MKDSAKHQLEGLLQARSDDLREGRVRRRRRPVEDPPFERPASGSDQGETPTRACAGCSEQIAPRRLRVLPSATRCLDCQRASEQAAPPS